MLTNPHPILNPGALSPYDESWCFISSDPFPCRTQWCSGDRFHGVEQESVVSWSLLTTMGPFTSLVSQLCWWHAGEKVEGQIPGSLQAAWSQAWQGGVKAFGAHLA